MHFLLPEAKNLYILSLDTPFWRSGGPPLHADSRGAPDLKVQKVHRKAGPDINAHLV